MNIEQASDQLSNVVENTYRLHQFLSQDVAIEGEMKIALRALVRVEAYIRSRATVAQVNRLSAEINELRRKLSQKKKNQ